MVEQFGDARVAGALGGVPRRGRAGDDTGDAEVGELADAVLDVEAQPSERLHQRLDVEAFVGPRAQVAKDAGPQRRLHEGAEPCIEIRRLGRFDRRGRSCAPRAEGQIIHAWRLVIGRDERRPTGRAGPPVIVGLIPLDQRFIRTASPSVPVARGSGASAARLDEDVREQEPVSMFTDDDVRHVDRFFLPADPVAA